jgi:hypothetical protein
MDPLKRICQHRALNVQDMPLTPSARPARRATNEADLVSEARIVYFSMDIVLSSRARSHLEANRSRPLCVFLIWFGWRRGSRSTTVERM